MESKTNEKEESLFERIPLFHLLLAFFKPIFPFLLFCSSHTFSKQMIIKNKIWLESLTKS
uniref:Hypothetic protein n=1 Tax=Enterococcus durans TaxID=53345 RepID=F8WK37_9ENTE|nr:hypothetic protein [Enterococcus durans]